MSSFSAWIWQPLQLVILSKRPFSSGAAYKSIWNEEADESPLMTITKAQTAAIKAEMIARYGDDASTSACAAAPFDQIQSPGNGRRRPHQDPVLPALSTLRGCHRIANDQFFRALMEENGNPCPRCRTLLRFDPPISKRWPNLLNALTKMPNHARKSWCVHHRCLNDTCAKPVHRQCQKTTRLLKERLAGTTPRS